MARIEDLADLYGQHIATPWQRTVAGAQRVIMVAYDKELERVLRARKGEFETRTKAAGHDWHEVDLTSAFASWLADDLLFPDPEALVPDEDLEWIVRVSLESRRRVKEQQKRCFKSEFRNTHFSYIVGPEGVEQFVSTPELHSDEAIESDPLPPGQVWAVSPASPDAGPGLYRIEVACGPGAGVKVLNQPTPPAFRESVKVGEQNLYTRAKELVGDRNPREHEFSIQMRALDSDRAGAGLGVPVLVALCGALLGRNTRGGTIVVGALNLGGSIEMIPNAVRIAELAVDKQAQTLLMPVAARRQLNELPDELWTKINIEFYKDASDAVFKSLVE